MDETDLKLQEEKVTPENLEEIGFVAICIGLPQSLAESMKKTTPGSVIILDDLNEGFYALMQRKPEDAKIAEPEIGTDIIWEDTRPVSDFEFEL